MSHSSRGLPEGGRFGIGRFLLAIVLSAIWFLSLRPAVDPDYGWHIQNGRHVLDGAAFHGRDLYSWTASGYWIVHEWLTEAMMAVVHDSHGPPANSVLAALLGTLAFLMVAVRLRARGSTWAAMLLTVVLAFFCSIMSVGVRPQVLELVYLAALGLLIDKWLSGAVSPLRFILVIAAGSILWANTHGSFPLLPALLLLAAAGLLIQADRRWRVAVGAVAISAMCAMVNPWGWRIYGFATQSVTSKPTLALIDEWKRPDLLSGSLVPLDIAIALAGIAGIAALAARIRGGNAGRGSGPSIGIPDVMVAAGLLFLALSSGRHVMLFGIGAAPLVAWSIESAFARLRPRREDGGIARLTEGKDTRGIAMINGVAAAAVAVALVVSGWGIIGPGAQRAALEKNYPVGVLDDVLRLNRPPERLLNAYGWGGYLIERGAIPVFIDGRSELYGDAQLVRYAGIIHLEGQWKRTLDSLGITLILMPRKSRLAVAAEEAGWKIIAHDSVGALLRRP